MKKTVSFCAGFIKSAALVVLVALLITSTSFAQDALASNNPLGPRPASATAATATEASTPTPGTFTYTKNKKGKDVIEAYTSRNGVVLKVGDKIKLGIGMHPNNTFYNIRHTLTEIYVGNGDGISNTESGKEFTITKIVNGSSDIFGANKLAVAFYKCKGFLAGYAEIAIDAALAQKEFEIVK